MRAVALWISLIFVAVVMLFAIFANITASNNITGASTANVTISNPFFWPVLVILVVVYLFVLFKYRD